MKKVLIVEDDRFLANAYRIKLKSGGYDARVVSTGQEAIDALKTFVPSVIILDIILPGEDGFDALEEIRADQRLKNIPVVIISNLNQKEDIERGMELGAVEFITKTNLTLDGLVSKIESLTKKA